MPVAIAFGLLVGILIVLLLIHRQRPIIFMCRLKTTLEMQVAGFGGLIDDASNVRRNKVVLPDAKHKVAVITGGAKGIGKEVIRGLLKANMRVVMGIRNPEHIKRLESMENAENLQAFQLNLKSLESVKEFAQKVIKNYPAINLLVNNAGIMFGDYERTVDGFESQLAVNHLGHFYLTHLLLPALKKGGMVDGPSRVVNVTSCAHYFGKIFFEDINMNVNYDTTAAYAQSKLAQLLSARYVNKLLEEDGCQVRSFSVHPGIVDTDLFENTLFRHVPYVMKHVFKTPEKGAVSILFTCFDKDLDKKGGLYISNCIEGKSSGYSKNLIFQKKLFELSCQLVGIEENNFGRA